VTQPYRDNLLNHSLDDAIVAYRTWASLAKTQQFSSSVRTLDFSVYAVMIMAMIMTGVFAMDYYRFDRVPTYEIISVTYMPAAAAIVLQYVLNNNIAMALVGRWLYDKFKK